MITHRYLAHTILFSVLLLLLIPASLFGDQPKGELLIHPEGHAGPVRALVSLGNSRLLSASDDKTIILWDYWNNRQKKVISGKIDSGVDGQYHVLALSPDRHIFATAGFLPSVYHGSTSIRLHSTKSLEQMDLLSDATANRGLISALSFDNDGIMLYSGGHNGKIIGWDLRYNLKSSRFLAHSAAITGIHCTHDGLISTSQDGWIKRWQTGESRAVDSLLVDELGINCLSVGDNEKTIVLACQNGSLVILDRSFTIRQELRTSFIPETVSLSPEGDWLVCGGHGFGNDPSIAFFQRSHSGFRFVAEQRVHGGTVHTVVFLEDDVIASAGEGSFDICIWALRDNAPFLASQLSGKVYPFSGISAVNGSIQLATDATDRLEFNYLNHELYPAGKANGRSHDDVIWDMQMELRPVDENDILILPERTFYNSGIPSNTTARYQNVLDSIPQGSAPSERTSEDHSIAAPEPEPVLSVPEPQSDFPEYTLSASPDVVDTEILPLPVRYIAGRMDTVFVLFRDSLRAAEYKHLAGPAGVFTIAQNRWAIIDLGNSTVGVYDFSGQHIANLNGGQGEVVDMAVSPDQTRLYTLLNNHMIQSWNLLAIDKNLDENFPTIWDTFLGRGQLGPIKKAGLDSLARVPQRKAWLDVIQQLEAMGESATLYRITLERMVIDVQPLTTLFITDDSHRILWSPDGYYDCEPGSEKYFKWHVSRGLNHNATIFDADQLAEFFYRPDILSEIIQTGDPVEDILKRLEGESLLTKRVDSPPVVKFKYTFENEVLSQDTVTVLVEVTDTGGGIDAVFLYNNGKLVAPRKQFEDRIENWATQRGATLTIPYVVSLLPGPNQLQALALNRLWTPSHNAEMVLHTENIFKETRLFVVTAGVDKYVNPLYELEYAVEDARAFAEAIFHYGQGVFTDVKHIELYNRDVSRDSVEAIFDWIAQQAKPQDLFIFFYSGHGVVTEQKQGRDDEFFMVPYNIQQLYQNDAQIRQIGISAQMLQTWTARIPAQRQLLILDACRSERAINAFYNMGRTAGVAVLAATGANDYTYEYTKLGHGVFTYSVLEGLAGQADANHDNLVNLKELETYLLNRVPELTHEYRYKTQFPHTYVRDVDFPLGVVR